MFLNFVDSFDFDRKDVRCRYGLIIFLIMETSNPWAKLSADFHLLLIWSSMLLRYVAAHIVRRFFKSGAKFSKSKSHVFSINNCNMIIVDRYLPIHNYVYNIDRIVLYIVYVPTKDIIISINTFIRYPQ